RLSARWPGRDVVAVVHDGVIRAALRAALDCAPESVQSFRFDYLSATRLDYCPLDGAADAAAWRVVGVNRAA
ncbi:MAG TPA: histidine phosphatase family protein, partial [Azospirillaceae bacterium]|nr:histidine phosphatase family protein [Azospirillaceae bacterium]